MKSRSWLRRGMTVLVGAGALAALPASAGADGVDAGGAGGAAFGAPILEKAECRSSCTASTGINPGGLLRLQGTSLARVTRLVFMGGPGNDDNREADALHATDSRVDVRVPRGARTGEVRAVADDGVMSAPSDLQVGIGEPSPVGGAPIAPTADGYAFPIQGHYTFAMGTGRFGAQRAGHIHQGQDVMADCGLPLVAARGGTVKYSGVQSAAGNYIVIAADDGQDMGYMHLREPSPLKKGDTVVTGQRIGVVGQTGDATACHLHFELWVSPGWYTGGHPIDPLPSLKVWAKGVERAKAAEKRG